MDRKLMIKKLGEHLGVKPKYLSVPTFNYEIRTANEVYTIDRHGAITKGDGELITMEEILSQPVIEEPTEVREESTSDEREQLQAEQETNSRETLSPSLQDLDGLELKMDMKDHTATSLKNIINMLYSKQRLIMMAFKTEQPFMDEGFAEDLNNENIEGLEGLGAAIETLGAERCPGFQIDFEERTFSFWLLEAELTPEKIKAFQDLCVLIANYARTLNRASFKQAQDDNPKYALRTWLIRIGMNGPEYKETRKTLLKHLEGSGAFRKVDEVDET